MRKIFTQEPKDCNILFCTRCAQEIFNYWVVVPLTMEEGPHYFCISCAYKRVDFLRNNESESRFFYKYQVDHIDEFMARIMRRIRDPKCRDDGKIPELTFKHKLEIIEPAEAETEKEKDISFRKNKFKRDISYREQKAKKVAEEARMQEERKVEETKIETETPQPAATANTNAGGWGEEAEEQDDGGWGAMNAAPVPAPPAPSGWENYKAEEKKEDTKIDNEHETPVEESKIDQIAKKDIKQSLMFLVSESAKENEMEAKTEVKKEPVKLEPVKVPEEKKANPSKSGYGIKEHGKFQKLEQLLKTIYSKRHIVVDKREATQLKDAYFDSYSANEIKKYVTLMPILKKIVKSLHIPEQYKIISKKMFYKFKKLAALNDPETSSRASRSPSKASQSPSKASQSPTKNQDAEDTDIAEVS